MASNDNTTNGSVGFLGLLALLFIALKLTGYVEWTWLWVLSPIWIPFTCVLIFLIVYVVLHLAT